MEKIKCTILVGLSGAGKTTWAREQNDGIVIDSDECREELWGDASDQQNPAKVFDLMYRRTISNLAEGKSVYYSATNLSSKRRIALVKTLRDHFKDSIEINCAIISTPVEVARQRNSERSRMVPAYVIDKQLRQFQFPLPAEGFDNIFIINTGHDEMIEKQKLWYKVMEYGDQHNPHHSCTLQEHCRKCCNYLLENTNNDELAIAGFFHDVGKIWTGVHWETDEDPATLHYPNHANLSAYYAMVCGLTVRGCQLISLHMVRFASEKEQEVWRSRAGESLWKDLQLLWEADANAH